MKKILVFCLMMSLTAVAFAGNEAAETFDPAASVQLSAQAYNGQVFLMAAPGELYNNGPLATCTGCGSGGADESVLENTTLGMSTLGVGHQISFNHAVADDFEVTGNWNIATITFFAYQTGSTTTSTINDVRLRIWDGPPGPGSSIIWGDFTTNVLASTAFTNIYRTTETTTGDTSRPIMANTVTVGLELGPGTYWLDWQTGGTLGSGPWVPPVTISGQATTGNALQSLYGGTYNPFLDGGTSTPLGFPFIITGTDSSIPTLNEWGAMIMVGILVLLSALGMRRRTSSGSC